MVEIILIVILVIIMALLFTWAFGNIKNKVPFIGASRKVLKDIEKALDIKDNSVVYDLGSGDGRILFYLSKNNKNAKYIGVENSSFPIFLSKIINFFNFKKTGAHIKIVNNDFFKEDLSNATHIFMYLYPSIMDELLSKFGKELKSGTKIVSLSFQFNGKIPNEEIDLHRSKNKLNRRLYVYQF